MAGKENNVVAKPAPTGKALQVHLQPGETETEAHSRAMLSPMTNAALNVINYHPIPGGSDVNGILAEITKQAKMVQAGDMSGPEAMLVSQAHTLDILFSSFAQRAAFSNQAGHFSAMESYMKLALKAQSQCRTTIEALGELKHPRTATFIKQANIAGQQQVNNGDGAKQPPEKNITPTNELITEQQHAEMDPRGTSAAIGADPQLEAVGAINRAH